MSNIPAYNWLYYVIRLFDHQNQGIDTWYVEIYIILVKKDTKYNFGTGETFYPYLPFSDNFDKDTHL